MNNLFKKLFPSSFRNVPQKIKDALFSSFPAAINPEWDEVEGIYEAVFYVNEIEHIAKIDKNAEILEYKQNLKINELPELVIQACLQTGEIMNAIAIVSRHDVRYEVIVRDEKLNRFVLLFDKAAKRINIRAFK